jgi:hypothetical protein
VKKSKIHPERKTYKDTVYINPLSALVEAALLRPSDVDSNYLFKNQFCRQNSNLAMENLEWLNTPDLYVDYCHLSEVPQKALRLIRSYGQFFDESYSYWQPKDRHKKLLPLLKRRPIWMTSKRMPAEKWHMHIDTKKSGQKQILEGSV